MKKLIIIFVLLVAFLFPRKSKADSNVFLSLGVGIGIPASVFVAPAPGPFLMRVRGKKKKPGLECNKRLGFNNCTACHSPYRRIKTYRLRKDHSSVGKSLQVFCCGQTASKHCFA